MIAQSSQFSPSFDSPVYLDSPVISGGAAFARDELAAPTDTVEFTFGFDQTGSRITRLSLNPSAPPLVSHLDWLTVHGDHFADLPALNSALALVLDSEAFRWDDSQGWSAGPGAKSYSHRLVSDSLPIQGGYNLIELGDNAFYIEVCIRFEGKFFEALTLEQQYIHLRKLWYFGFNRCTRLDIAIDDFTCQIIPHLEMTAAAYAGNIFGCSKFNPFVDYDMKKQELTGYALYFGSRNSSKFSRVYLHPWDDETFSLRHEIVFSRDCAQSIFWYLCCFEDGTKLSDISALNEDNLPYDVDKLYPSKDISNLSLSEDSLKAFASALAMLCAGHFDFRDKSKFSDKANPSRKHSQRLEFWQKYLDIIGGTIHVKRSSQAFALELPRSVRWLFTQCSSLFSALYNGLGSQFEHFAHIWADYGSQKLLPYHWDMIDLFQKFPALAYDCAGDLYQF